MLFSRELPVSDNNKQTIKDYSLDVVLMLYFLQMIFLFNNWCKSHIYNFYFIFMFMHQASRGLYWLSQTDHLTQVYLAAGVATD